MSPEPGRPAAEHPGWARLRPRRGRPPPEGTLARIDVYGAHGGEGGVVVRGRTVHASALGEAEEDDPWHRNVRAMVGRFRRGALPHRPVEVEAAGKAVEVLSDDEGYFVAHLEVPAPPEIGVSLAVDPDERRAVTVPVLGPPDGGELGVVSDLDDTVLRTGARRPLSMVWRTLTGNAWSRTPFEGVEAFYAALHRGARGRGGVPFFYVSSSPWNLHDFLVHFLRIHGLPPGVLLLRDIDFDLRLVAGGRHHDHKLGMVDEVFRVHPTLSFVLVGDSGQKDPEIYREVVRRHPGRVRAVYLRDVTDPGRDAEVRALGREMGRSGVPVVYGEATDGAWQHAAAAGWADAPGSP